jgi:hypothetical protein
VDGELGVRVVVLVEKEEENDLKREEEEEEEGNSLRIVRALICEIMI